MSDLPAMIGPYQVLKPLGAGGMGEVFLAYDERLDRKVAIKRIRSGAGLTPERRERFRREARVAAKLNHPAIVQIYDVLTAGDESYIVMEHVEGTNLQRLLDDGPLPVDEVVALARDVAQGLAEAHRQGIVHRDLKSENVLVTPEGRAKIADFGIAKRVLAGTDGTDGDSLTADGRVLGTYRVMSPEQARGEPVDFRSDLFSLGVLLYEALAGQSPFAAENELAMLSRIVRDRQAPVREVRPGVSEELSNLIDHLLEKDPLARPRSAREVTRALSATTALSHDDTPTLAEPLRPFPGRTAEPSGARRTANSDSALAAAGSRKRAAAALLLLLLLAVLGVIAYRSLRSPATPLYVAVLAPEVVRGGGRNETDLLVAGVRSGLVRALVSLENVSPKATEEVAGASGSPTQVARAVAADELVASRLDCRPESCRITLDRIRGRDGALLWSSESFEVPTDDVYLAARAAANQLRRAYPEHPVRHGMPEVEVNSQDFAALLRLRQRFDSRREASLDPILDDLAKIRGRSPRFLEAYLLEADVARYKFAASRHPEDLQRAFDLVRQARELAPGDPQPLFVLFGISLQGGKLDAAEEALSQLERLTPGDVAVQDRRAQLLDARGHPREALLAMHDAVRQRPSWKRLLKLAKMQYQQGQTAAARTTLKQLLARSPDNSDGLSVLAQIELTNGDARRAAELYGQIVRRSPGLTELGNLGLSFFVLGRYAEAADVFRRAAGQAPNNALVALNLADSYYLMGRRDEAQSLYRQILALIAADPSAATDPQFLTVKGQALAHLGQGPAAVAAVQEALRIAPNNAAVAYEASLIYAVLGEDDSALANAERAVKLGYAPVWFSLPWFAPLRSHPELQALLARS
ncbi:MAG TPA: protein kinase [Thermoanaerobaculia bacterium]|nr:protein kinase [Thermoanaerobaculia bacterium]